MNKLVRLSTISRRETMLVRVSVLSLSQSKSAPLPMLFPAMLAISAIIACQRPRSHFPNLVKTIIEQSDAKGGLAEELEWIVPCCAGVGWFRDACLECDACVKGDDVSPCTSNLRSGQKHWRWLTMLPLQIASSLH